MYLSHIREPSVGGDYYERLGVSRDASRETIASAYREKLKETHPDVSDDSDAQERTKRLIEAKEVLTDESERARYDRLGHEQYVGDDSTGADSTTAATGRDTADTGHTRQNRAPDGNASEDFFNQWVDGTATTGAAPGDFFTGWAQRETASGSTVGDETTDRRRRTRQNTRGRRGARGAEHGGVWGDSERGDPAGWETNRTATTGDGEETANSVDDFFTDWATEDETDQARASETTADGAPGDFFDWTASEDIGAGPGETASDSGSREREASAETATSTATATGETAGRQSGATRRGPENSSVDWYQSTRDQPHQRNRSWDAMTKGIHSPWPGGGVAETYAVRHDREPTESAGLFSSDRVLFVFGFTFVIYPVLLFGAVLPAFPLAVRAVIATGALLVTAFLQSIPQIGLFVFGTWAILVPVLLGTVGLPLLAVEGILLLTAVVFPFLFSLLTWLTVRPRSL
jgi:molecular chaperone DnaJ